MTNADAIENQVPVYTQNTIFPRMYVRNDAQRANGYRNWSGYDANRKVPQSQIGDDGRPIPTFGNNVTYFVNYQVNWMYLRYFMWNFAVTRYNDDYRIKEHFLVMLFAQLTYMKLKLPMLKHHLGNHVPLYLAYYGVLVFLVSGFYVGLGSGTLGVSLHHHLYYLL